MKIAFDMSRTLPGPPIAAERDRAAFEPTSRDCGPPPSGSEDSSFRVADLTLSSVMTQTPRSFRDHVSDDARLVRFYDHWLALRGGRPLPGPRDFDPAPVQDLMPSVASVEVRGSRYFVRRVGAEMATRIGSDATGLYLDQHARGAFLDFMNHVYGTVREQRRPVLSQTTYGVGRWNAVKLRRLSVPFGDSAGGVSEILSLVLFSWRPDADPVVVDYADEVTASRHRLQAIGE
jgi:hypothetical protein